VSAGSTTPSPRRWTASFRKSRADRSPAPLCAPAVPCFNGTAARAPLVQRPPFLISSISFVPFVSSWLYVFVFFVSFVAQRLLFVSSWLYVFVALRVLRGSNVFVSFVACYVFVASARSVSAQSPAGRFRRSRYEC
jgi:hypothetical protein